MTRVFFDTNVLAYAEDTGAGAKRDRSRQLILAAVAANTAVLSTQVLMEFYNVAVRRLRGCLHLNCGVRPSPCGNESLFRMVFNPAAEAAGYHDAVSLRRRPDRAAREDGRRYDSPPIHWPGEFLASHMGS